MIAMAALIACGSKESEKQVPPDRKTIETPDPADYKTMSPERRCEATTSRGGRCYSQLLQAEADELGADVDLGLKPNSREDRDAYLEHCRREPGLADAVFECWSRTDCKDHVKCVLAAQARGPIDPPDRDRMRAMSPSERCEAMAPRAKRCRAELAQALPPPTTRPPVVDAAPPDDEPELRIERGPGRRRIQVDNLEVSEPYRHVDACSNPAYVDAIAACWKTEPCEAFTRCVKDRVH